MAGIPLSTPAMQDGKTRNEVASDSYAATMSRKDKKRKGRKERKKTRFRFSVSGQYSQLSIDLKG